MGETKKLFSARMRLIETGGRTSQDLGLGRIVGQVLVYLYLSPSDCSLEELEEELGLSKASVSIAARQLEQLGLVQRIWKKGERKKYYRSAENIGQALQQGLLSLVRKKVVDFGTELDATLDILREVENNSSPDIEFLLMRINRARKLQGRLNMILGNPLVRLLSRTTDKDS